MKKNTSRSVNMKAPAVEMKVDVKETTRGTIPNPPDYQAVVGLDVGDRQTHYCVLDLNGALAVEGVVTTREASFRMQFEGKARMRIALEAGTHSPWISRLLVELGHDVIVANPRNLRMISESDSKNDPADARLLARLAHVGPELLSPIKQRSRKTQEDLTLVRAREVAVQCRTKIVNAMRGIVKSTGHRLPASSTLTFARKAKEACPEALKSALLPLLRVIEELTREIARRFNLFYPRHGGAGMGIPRGPETDEQYQRRFFVFPEPQSLLTPAPKLPGTDGRKMSKSYGNTVLLTDPEPVVRLKLKTMVTDPARVRRNDPGNPDVCPVGDLHKIFSSKETMAKVYEGCRSAGIGCIECKSWAADALVKILNPMQERRKKYEDNPRLAWDILEAGSARAREVAGATMDEVRESMGLDYESAKVSTK